MDILGLSNQILSQIRVMNDNQFFVFDVKEYNETNVSQHISEDLCRFENKMHNFFAEIKVQNFIALQRRNILKMFSARRAFEQFSF